MIFFTLGSHQPFDRLVQAVDDWCAASGRGADVFGQVVDPGAAGYRPRHFDWVTHLPPAEYRRRFETADFVIAHAGMGSIITAMSAGVPIAVLPRRARFGEMRNDHQVATVKRFRGRPGIHAALWEDELPAILDALAAGPGRAGAPDRISPFAEPRLTAALKRMIRGKE
ncbi:MAG: glycosyltransferase [Paracoccaceae bacterium]